MPYKDISAQREYQRQWMANRRAQFFAGKSCAQCGGTESLELDHIDPTIKVHHCVWSWSADRRLAELAKCQVLCKDCHLTKTVTQMPITHGYQAYRHGTVAMYNAHECRCGLCMLSMYNAHECRCGLCMLCMRFRSRDVRARKKQLIRL